MKVRIKKYPNEKAGMFLPNQQYGGPQRMDIGGGLLPVVYTSPDMGAMQGLQQAAIPQGPEPAAPTAHSGLDKFLGKRAGDIATSTNNPGNMKYAAWQEKFGAQPSGIPGADGGEFAAFPDVSKGLEAYKQQLFGDTDGTFRSRYYKADITVEAAMKKWSNGGYGGDIYPEIAKKKLGDLTPEQRDELVKRQIHRESPTMFNVLHKQGYYKEGGMYEGGKDMLDQLTNNGYSYELL